MTLPGYDPDPLRPPEPEPPKPRRGGCLWAFVVALAFWAVLGLAVLGAVFVWWRT